MMILDKKFFQNEYAKIILGIIWGFGLACIFNCACNGRKCIIYKAPKPFEVKNNIYGYQDKCYQYETVNTKCNENPIK